jgi:transcriptional regulator of arginine metabolism
MKNARQQKILELIEKYDIDTQDTLIKRLSDEGYNVTQTTASRDIRQLNLVKGISSKGTYKYVAPGTALNTEARVPFNASLAESVIKIEAACNIVVVKTFSGMANAVAVFLDSVRHESIVGCVAGDDTILLVVRTPECALQLEAEFKETFMKK